MMVVVVDCVVGELRGSAGAVVGKGYRGLEGLQLLGGGSLFCFHSIRYHGLLFRGFGEIYPILSGPVKYGFLL